MLWYDLSLMYPRHHKKRQIRLTQAHHITLKCAYYLFTQNRVRQIIDHFLEKYCAHFGIRIYHRAVVGNHIHLVLMPRKEEDLHGFLRVFSGQLSTRFRELKLVPLKAKNIWQLRPWSRVIKWGRAYTTAMKYVALNYLEGINRIKRTHKQDEIRRHKHLIDEVIKHKLTQLPDKQLSFA